MIHRPTARRSPASRRSVLSAAVLVFAVACAAVTAGNGQRPEAPHALDALRFGTGWVLLGFLDNESQLWTTILKHRVKERRVASDSIVPLPGDVLELSMELQVYIVDYQARGEENRLVSPADRMLTKDNLTGVTLLAGTEVVAEEVILDSPGYNVQSVWARVTRPPR